jgi:hypothetical protein
LTGSVVPGAGKEARGHPGERAPEANGRGDGLVDQVVPGLLARPTADVEVVRDLEVLLLRVRGLEVERPDAPQEEDPLLPPQVVVPDEDPLAAPPGVAVDVHAALDDLARRPPVREPDALSPLLRLGQGPEPLAHLLALEGAALDVERRRLRRQARGADDELAQRDLEVVAERVVVVPQGGLSPASR